MSWIFKDDIKFSFWLRNGLKEDSFPLEQNLLESHNRKKKSHSGLLKVLIFQKYLSVLSRQSHKIYTHTTNLSGYLSGNTHDLTSQTILLCPGAESYKPQTSCRKGSKLCINLCSKYQRTAYNQLGVLCVTETNLQSFYVGKKLSFCLSFYQDNIPIYSSAHLVLWLFTVQFLVNEEVCYRIQ